ncbi:P-loop NTPase fold protein [Chloroflexota bacterium]
MDDREDNNKNNSILIDEPITKAEQDKLQRDEFAGHFAKTLLSHTAPACLIAALYGRWGSGKSSILNLVENHLWANNSDGKYIIIRFNPWNISNLDQLIAMFFHEIKVAVIGADQSRKIKDNVIALLDVFSGILAVGQLSPIGNQYFGMGEKIVKNISGTLENKKDISLDKLKKELNDELFSKADRIIILIDDIDRLDLNAMKLLFRMIRLNADFYNTTYLLSFDNVLVEDLLNAEQPGHGKEYLGKIVQLPVTIPGLDEAVLIEILTHELDKIIEDYTEHQFDANLWRDLVSNGRFFKFFESIRDVVKYINGLRLNYGLIADEVNIVDFMAIEAIRIFKAESYDLIRRNKALITRSSIRGTLEREENVEQTKKMLDHIFDPAGATAVDGEEGQWHGELTRDVCKVLFPQLSRIYANSSYSDSSLENWRKQKRICSPAIFDKYFLLGVPKGEISDEEMRTTLARSSDYLTLLEAIYDLFERGLGKRFLERVEDYLDEIPETSVLEVIIALFEAEEKIISERRVMLGMSADLQAARIIYLLLMKIGTPKERMEAIIEAINKSSNLFLPVYFISLTSPEEGGSSRRDETARDLGFTPENIQELQKLGIKMIKERAESGTLSKTPHLAMLLFRWLHWGEEVEVKEYVAKLVESEEGLLDFLIGISSEVLSSDSGRRVEINKDNIGKFIDINIIEPKVIEIRDSKWDDLTESQRESVTAFFQENIF